VSRELRRPFRRGAAEAHDSRRETRLRLRKQPPSGVCPAKGGDQAAGIRSRGFPPGGQVKGVGNRTIRLALSPEMSDEGHAML